MFLKFAEMLKFIKKYLLAHTLKEKKLNYKLSRKYIYNRPHLVELKRLGSLLPAWGHLPGKIQDCHRHYYN